MKTTNGAGNEGRQRQDAEGRRQVGRKLHEHVLEQMDMPERAVLQARACCPEHLSGIHVGQREAATKRARNEWEASLMEAIQRRLQLELELGRRSFVDHLVAGLGSPLLASLLVGGVAESNPSSRSFGNCAIRRTTCHHKHECGEHMRETRQTGQVQITMGKTARRAEQQWHARKHTDT